jgi:hypothetical protein
MLIRLCITLRMKMNEVFLYVLKAAKKTITDLSFNNP